MEQREGHAQEVSRFDLAKVALARTGEKAKVLFQMWSPYKVALDAQPSEELGESRVRKRLDLGEDGNDEESEESKMAETNRDNRRHLKQKRGYVWACKEARRRSEYR